MAIATFLFLLASLSTALEGWGQARTHVLLVGGGCEEDALSDRDNPFFMEFKEAQKEYRRLGVELKTYFGDEGSHKLKAESFEQGSFFQELDQLSSQNWQDGDRLLIQINTHGSQAEGNTSHGVCFTEFNQGGEAKNVFIPVSQIMSKLEALKKQFPGLNVALFDNSCYGGDSVTQAPQSPVCVISSTSNYSTAGFRERFNFQFLKKAKKGVALSELYLQALPSSPVSLSKNRDIPLINCLRPEIIDEFSSVTEFLRETEDDTEIPRFFPIAEEDDEDEEEEDGTSDTTFTDRSMALSSVHVPFINEMLGELRVHGPQSPPYVRAIDDFEQQVRNIRKKWPLELLSVLMFEEIHDQSLNSSVRWQCFQDLEIKPKHASRHLSWWFEQMDADLRKYFQSVYRLRQQFDEYLITRTQSLGPEALVDSPAAQACQNWRF